MNYPAASCEELDPSDYRPVLLFCPDKSLLSTPYRSWTSSPDTEEMSSISTFMLPWYFSVMASFIVAIIFSQSKLQSKHP